MRFYNFELLCHGIILKSMRSEQQPSPHKNGGQLRSKTLKGRRLSKYYQDITTLNYITTLVCMLFPLVTSKNVKKLNSLSKKEKKY